ncbi:MAG TPA: hypothetical protein VMP01_08970 [Pirellulaceae bacterium]|nr:hypothetical protein [Pirellulaceae bacterium]
MVAPSPPSTTPPAAPTKAGLIAEIYFATRLIESTGTLLDHLTAATIAGVGERVDPHGNTYTQLATLVQFWKMRKEQAEEAMRAKGWPVPEIPMPADWLAKNSP